MSDIEELIRVISNSKKRKEIFLEIFWGKLPIKDNQVMSGHLRKK